MTTTITITKHYHNIHIT